MTTWDGIHRFRAACAKAGLPLPGSVSRALELLAVARAHASATPSSILAMSDDEARDCLTDLAIRSHTDGDKPALRLRGINPGLVDFEARLLDELRADLLPRLDELVVELQPRFDAVVAPLVLAAQEYHFTLETTSDEVLLLDDAGAIAAWRAVRATLPLVGPFVRFRTMLSEVFDLSPTREEQRSAAQAEGIDLRIGRGAGGDYSVCFAAGGDWSLDGNFYVEGHIDWLRIASGGLRLNTPTEVAAKLAERKQLRQPEYTMEMLVAMHEAREREQEQLTHSIAKAARR